MAEEDPILRYLPLYKAALTDDWDAADTFLRNDRTADLTDIITTYDQTVLHIAVGVKSSHRFVTKLVERIRDTDPKNYKTKLRSPDYQGNTALHYAATMGNTVDARTLVGKDPDLPLIRNDKGATAMTVAAFYGHKEILEYLLDITRRMVTEDTITTVRQLLCSIMDAEFYDIAFKLMNRYRGLAVRLINETDGFHKALQKLARHPEAFPSGRNWWFWNNLIYSWIPENSGCFNSTIKYVPFLKSIRDTKLVEKQAYKLMKAMINLVMKSGNHELVREVLGRAMHEAAKYGIHELIEECVSHYPSIIWYQIDNMFLLMVAIEYRQVKVFNLHYQMTAFSAQAYHRTDDGNNLLHLAAKKASPDSLNTITGAALQMQRELQWFKEVEKFVCPYDRKHLNADKKTPQMVFKEEHKDLMEKGEKWMKVTATSSTLVAALIVTVAFAAIFTVPGGNADNGKPNFVLDAIFMVFAVADSLALFSSVTSVLMFTALLTSRYSEYDFLYALPKRMTIGLLSLFISIASIMITFCAALVLVIRAKVSWIAIPAGVAAVVPVTCFALLQFSLLVELVLSTFGPNIFRKQNNVILH